MKRDVTVLKKSVQCMVTWLNSALHVWEMLHFSNINNGYFSIGQDEASLVRLRCEFIIDHLPDWYLKVCNKSIDRSSTKKIEFKGRLDGEDAYSLNILLFKHSGGKGGRSVTFNRISLDEAGFMENGAQVYGANKPRCRYMNVFSSPSERKTGFFWSIWSNPKDFDIDTSNLFEIHYTVFPDRNPNHSDPELAAKGADWVAKERRGMSQEKWEREYEGKWISEGGLVYKTFGRSTHVRKVTPQLNWEYYLDLDFGYEHPFAGLILARERAGSVIRWYILREHYKRKLLLKEHADALKIMMSEKVPIIANSGQKTGEWVLGSKIIKKISDAAGKQERMELKSYGIDTQPSRKHSGSVAAKIDRMRTFLEKQSDGDYGLIVDESCTNTIMEFENYSYPKDVDEGDHEKDPVKKFDHALDAAGDCIYTVTSAEVNYLKERR